ncbi:carboxyl transferase domain-containing protein [Qaidamihabitans albus]|uniref:carboxyl transferase domain-containing protein n=1 Tax=Qaidamihabitans albus TaxID=2795733 RepID=UPI0022A819F6
MLRRRVRQCGEDELTEFSELLPERPAYDVRRVVDRLLDAPPVELQPGWARNVVADIGRLGGGTVGVVASNPLHRGDCLDSRSAEKAARFVRMCDGFGIPWGCWSMCPDTFPGRDLGDGCDGCRAAASPEKTGGRH